MVQAMHHTNLRGIGAVVQPEQQLFLGKLGALGSAQHRSEKARQAHRRGGEGSDRRCWRRRRRGIAWRKRRLVRGKREGWGGRRGGGSYTEEEVGCLCAKRTVAASVSFVGVLPLVMVAAARAGVVAAAAAGAG